MKKKSKKNRKKKQQERAADRRVDKSSRQKQVIKGITPLNALRKEQRTEAAGKSSRNGYIRSKEIKTQNV